MPTIKTPATTANLGSGFDILGMALKLYNVYTFNFQDNYEFVDFDARYSNIQNNLIITSYHYVCNKEGIEPLAIKLIQKREIPISRGLGSSSSLIVTGVLIANNLLKNKLSKKELLKYATELEGHPDNVAPCLFGGLIASIVREDSIETLKYPISNDYQFLLSIPNYELSTRISREVLKNDISRENSIKTSANLLFMLEGLKTGNDNYLKIGVKDYIHTPYRIKLIKDYDKIGVILNNYTIAHTISGAGPSILSITKDIDSRCIVELDDLAYKTIVLEVDNIGATIL